MGLAPDEAMKVIDIESWERKTQFQNFSKYTHPVFSVAVRLDVTEAVLFCKKNNYSFFPVFLFLLAKCCNSIPELRTRMENGRVIQHEVIHPSYVVLREDNSIATCLTDYDSDFRSFYANARADIDATKTDVSEREFNSVIRTDCLYISSMQWMDIVTVNDPYDFNCEEQTSIPRITWGKYVERPDGKYEMGFHISAHHGLMDGYHISQLIGRLENEMKNINSIQE